ncbi:hypothetical protein CsSME_00011249 [Camellia sinensis var. sinensis]
MHRQHCLCLVMFGHVESRDLMIPKCTIPENHVKFHVISHHKLRRCSNSPNISSKYYLNMEQLTKALTSLYHLYEANRNIQSIYENEAEFRSLYVLLHLGCDNKPMFCARS